MLATLKIHSAFSPHFDNLEYTVDAQTYADFVPYLSAMHPKFRNYMLQINNSESEESFCFLDQDLNIIDQEAIFIKRIKDGEIVHLVPAIVGGGGKRGLLPLLLIGVVIAGPMIAAAMQGGAAVSAGIGGVGGVSGGAIAAAGMGPGASAAATGGLFAGMNSFAMRMIGNLALNMLTSLFAKKPKQQERDTTTRESNMFGSLQNSTTSGTPIPLVYGHMRVGGQMLSGYIDSEVHGKSDIVSVGEKFD